MRCVGGLARDLGQHRGELLARDRIDVAVGGQDHQPHGAELAGEELQEQQRRLVGGVHVVERQQDRAAPRDALRRNSAVASKRWKRDHPTPRERGSGRSGK